MGQYDELKDQVLAFMQKKKKKLMVNEVLKGLQKAGIDVKKKDLKRATVEMIEEGTIAYWSSGSTTYLSLPESIVEEREE